MSQHGRALAVLGMGIAVALSGLVLARDITAVAGEAETERLQGAVLAYVVEKNPEAPLTRFQQFPAILLAEAGRSNIDHCLALAQAQVESQFRPDAVGTSGEIGLFQVLPSTAAAFEPVVGPFRRPAWARGRRDLGDLADPVVSTRFAMAYLRDIMQRRSSLRDVLTEYNAGPRGRTGRYYAAVMATYVELLERPELGCGHREGVPPASAHTFSARV